jgi:hypothetical protein
MKCRIYYPQQKLSVLVSRFDPQKSSDTILTMKPKDFKATILNNDEWLVEFYAALKPESQRGKIIILTALIDDLLCEMLNAFLKRSRTKEDKLFTQLGALGHFAARIEMAHRLGLISQDAANCYDMLRKIRNDCAHNSKNYSFDDKAHSAKFTKLKSLTYRITGVGLILEYVDDIGKKTNDNAFTMLCGIQISYLRESLQHLKQTPDRFSAADFSDE